MIKYQISEIQNAHTLGETHLVFETQVTGTITTHKCYSIDDALECIKNIEDNRFFDIETEDKIDSDGKYYEVQARTKTQASYWAKRNDITKDYEYIEWIDGEKVTISNGLPHGDKGDVE